jgi:hypothetical protein
MRESSRLWVVSAVSVDTRVRVKEATTRAQATTNAEAAIGAKTLGTPRGGMASDGVHLES